MSREELKNKNIRKICVIGSRSLGITIPIEILKDLKWRKKQKVIVKKIRGGVQIKDWKK